MRSRYTAYAYRLPQWVMSTTHRTNVDWRSDAKAWQKELLGFCDGFEFVSLEVLKEEPGASPDEFFVEFMARLKTSRQPKDAPKDVKARRRSNCRPFIVS